MRYMKGNGAPNVMWCIRCSAENDSGYHRGADISLLSQFANEKEVLRHSAILPDRP